MKAGLLHVLFLSRGAHVGLQCVHLGEARDGGALEARAYADGWQRWREEWRRRGRQQARDAGGGHRVHHCGHAVSRLLPDRCHVYGGLSGQRESAVRTRVLLLCFTFTYLTHDVLLAERRWTFARHAGPPGPLLANLWELWHWKSHVFSRSRLELLHLHASCMCLVFSSAIFLLSLEVLKFSIMLIIKLAWCCPLNNRCNSSHSISTGALVPRVCVPLVALWTPLRGRFASAEQQDFSVCKRQRLWVCTALSSFQSFRYCTHSTHTL